MLIFLLSAFSISAATAETVTETFGSWFSPTTKPTEKDVSKVYENTSPSTKIKYSSKNTYYNSQSKAIIMVGNSQNEGEISFSLDYAIAKLTIKSGSNTGTKGKIAVYANDTKITSSDIAINKTASNYIVDIPSTYQAAGTVYKVANTSSNNSQFQSFTYTKVEEDGG